VYNWVAARHNADTADAVYAAISKVATSIKGWKAIGYPIRKPRRTWIATGLNSTFTIQLDSLKEPINQMMVLYLKSYGDNLILLVATIAQPVLMCLTNMTWETFFNLGTVYESHLLWLV